MEELIQVCLLGFIVGFGWHHRHNIFAIQKQMARDAMFALTTFEEVDEYDPIKRQYVNDEITEQEMERLLDERMSPDVPTRLNPEDIENRHAAVKTDDGAMYLGYKYKKCGDHYVLYE